MTPRRFVFAMFFAAAPALTAQESGGSVFSLHGYGTYGYGSTNGNEYLVGRAGGDGHYIDLALNAAVRLGERVRLNAQGDWRRQELVRAALDYAFVDYRHSDALTARAGQVKQPFGISAETYRVGVVRPFLFLPQAVYGAVGFAGLAYRGVGLTGSFYGATGWGASYDAYGGALHINESERAYAFLGTEPVEEGGDADEHDIEGATERMNRLVGGRLVLSSPMSGLAVGASSWTAIMSGDEGVVDGARRSSAGMHVEYAGSRLSLRAEAALEREADYERKRAGYVEGALRLGRGWQAAVQSSQLAIEMPSEPGTAGSPLLWHRETGLGLNYWARPWMVVRVAAHQVRGNRIALPDHAEANAAIPRRTRLITFGTQVSF